MGREVRGSSPLQPMSAPLRTKASLSLLCLLARYKRTLFSGSKSPFQACTPPPPPHPRLQLPRAGCSPLCCWSPAWHLPARPLPGVLRGPAVEGTPTALSPAAAGPAHALVAGILREGGNTCMAEGPAAAMGGLWPRALGTPACLAAAGKSSELLPLEITDEVDAT